VKKIGSARWRAPEIAPAIHDLDGCMKWNRDRTTWEQKKKEEKRKKKGKIIMMMAC